MTAFHAFHCSPLGCTREALRVFERPRYLPYTSRAGITAVVLAGQRTSTAEDNALSDSAGSDSVVRASPGEGQGVRDKAR